LFIASDIGSTSGERRKGKKHLPRNNVDGDIWKTTTTSAKWDIDFVRMEF